MGAIILSVLIALEDGDQHMTKGQPSNTIEHAQFAEEQATLSFHQIKSLRVVLKKIT